MPAASEPAPVARVARVTQLRWIAATCAIAGLGALVAHVFGVLEMPYFLSFIGVPSLLLLYMTAVFARRLHSGVFLTALRVGLAGGLAGTIVYDGVRFGLYQTGVFNYDGFRAIYLFGSWMTRSDVSSVPAAIGGWLYHFWNGASFGMFYALMVGRAPWFYGVMYGIVMELCMLGLFPMFLRVSDRADFIALSLIGHLFYGLVLGVVVQRYGRSWRRDSAGGGAPGR
jgi:hypothetical protein